jgi:uracil-DNA glycosylase
LDEHGGKVLILVLQGVIMNSLDELNREIVQCRRCPRLVRWREACAVNPPRRYKGMEYWARPLAGFGDPQARVLIVGLAPAANGGNRTGRMFTGDRSGDWLYGALHAFGFANQPQSQQRNDGLQLRDCYITAAVHCAPPLNKPNSSEFERCRRYLVQELKILPHVRVTIVLGKIAFDSFLKAYRDTGATLAKPKPVFAHGLRAVLSDKRTLICSYHPSQQNTFTGKLTQKMFYRIFEQARALL